MSEEAKTQEEEQSEFESAFNEAAAKKDGVESQEIDNPDPGEPPKNEDPSPAPGDGEINEDPEPDDMYAGWPEEAIESHKAALAENEKLKHRVQSDSGRVSAFQRKINEMESTVSSLTEEINSIRQSSDKAQPTKQEISDAMGDDESWAQFQEDYPEVAEAIDNRLNKVIGTQEEKINTVIAPVLEEKHEKELEKAYDAVAAEFPSWQDAVREADFSEWLETQPAAVQQLAASDDVYDASSLIGLYDNHRIASGLNSLRAQKTDPNPDNGGVVDETNELAERRARQLEDGVSLPSRSARVDPSAETGEDEFERSFNAFAARKESQRA